MNRRSQKLAALTVVAVCTAIGVAVLWHFRDYLDREHLEFVLERFAKMGPWVFFGLMTVLPLFWAPLSPFLLLAPAFGTSVAIVGCFTALAVNMMVAWFVSGKWFRPAFVRLVERFGYSIPELSPSSMIGVAFLLRLTPGMPFTLQNYLLGLAQMPLGKYMLVSVPIMWCVSASFILLGESVMRGNWHLALIAVGLGILVAIILRYIRIRLKAKQIVTEGADGGA